MHGVRAAYRSLHECRAGQRCRLLQDGRCPQGLHYAMTACGTKLTCHPVERVSSRPGQPRRQALIGALRITTSPRRHQPMLAWKKADRNRKFTPAKGIGATEAWNWFQTLTGLRRFFQMP